MRVFPAFHDFVLSSLSEAKDLKRCLRPGFEFLAAKPIKRLPARRGGPVPGRLLASSLLKVYGFCGFCGFCGRFFSRAAFWALKRGLQIRKNRNFRKNRKNRTPLSVIPSPEASGRGICISARRK